MNKKKILSLIMALVMLVGVFSPLSALAAEPEKVTKTVTLHKLVMSKEELGKWNKAFSDDLEKKGYNGTQNTDQLKALLDEGHSAHEVAGVYFAVKYNSGNNKDKYVTINETDKDNPVYGVAESLDATVEAPFKLLAGKTTAKGIQFNTIGLKGDFLIEEIHEKSSYTGEAYVDKKGNELVKDTNGTFYKKGDKTKAKVNKDDVITIGTAITDSKAVPVEITLPLVNNDGVVTDAHVYPKNTEDKPKIDKNFAKAKTGEKELEVADGFAAADEGAGVGVGADYKNYEAKKATAKAEIGKKIPYEVKTEIPAKSNLKEAHWDDKMTEDKPKIDKNFAKAKTGEKELEVADGFAAADEGAGVGVGADYKNYEAKKATAKAEIGKKIPYEVKTEIPAKSNLKEAHWDDKMTEGLTFNKDLEVTIGQTKLAENTHYTLQQDEKGFSLRLNDEGLKLVNGKEEAVTVELKYSATVNSKAIVDIPEANDITFHYGNTPSKGNTPKPTKPNDNGEIKVVKTWDNGSEWVEGEYAKFKLVDANTGEDVTVDGLVQGKATKEEFEAYKKDFKGTVTLSKGTTENYTWKYLNKDKQYKVVEVESKTLSDAEYTKAADGTIEVTNHKSTNPKPLNPTEPKVVNGGKKFVKTNQEGTERLVGAQFIVLDSTGKNYLVAKSSTEENAANVDVTTAKKNLDDAVKAYNELSADEQKGEKGTKAKGDIDTAQQAYNKAVKDAAKAYKWEKLPAQLEDKKAPEGAVVLTSDSEGKFEITGLEYGSYKLKEITPPSGFAKLNGNVDFTVAKGSYAGDAEKEFKYEVKVDTSKGEKQTYGQQVKNKKVSIPQTGGMGTVLFTVVGISLMAGAVIAMKKNREEA